jgi:hypothetical protein
MRFSNVAPAPVDKHPSGKNVEKMDFSEEILYKTTACYGLFVVRRTKVSNYQTFYQLRASASDFRRIQNTSIRRSYTASTIAERRAP